MNMRTYLTGLVVNNGKAMTGSINEFLEISITGKPASWRYAVAIPIILFCWIVLGTILAIVICPSIIYPSKFPKTAFLEYIALAASFLPLTISVFMCTALLHGRKCKTLITPFAKINWKVMGIGAVCWFVLSGLAQFIGYLLRPSEYAFTFTPEILAQIPLIVPLTFLQAGSEELFFRGYILQALSRISKNSILLSTLVGIIFGLPHMANPEMAGDLIFGFLTYFSVGFFFTIVTIEARSLELSIGCHVAQNVFTASVVNYKGGTLETNSVFTILHSDAKYEMWSFCACALIGYLLFKKLGIFDHTHFNSVSPASDEKVT